MRLVYGTNAGTYFPQAKRRGGFLFLSSLLGSHTCSPPPPPEHRFSPSSMGHSTVYYSHPRKNCKGARKWYAREEERFLFMRIFARFLRLLCLAHLGARAKTTSPSTPTRSTRSAPSRERGEEKREKREKRGLELVDLDITIS